MSDNANIAMPLNILGDMSVEQFLQEYWQQKPLLIRNAWPDFDPQLEPEELAGLALEDNIESRIVLEKDGKKPWELRESPFSETDFTSLPASHWTLLVNDVEKHLPEFKDFLKPFQFLPNWRVDDLMISYASPQGSVGPHIDEYDVFLLQAYGQRHWQISEEAVSPDNYLANTDLRILQSFTAEQDWVLNPGDMLYLPPKVAHHGVAIDRCMTYSIGLRAPTDVSLFDSFIDHLYDIGHTPTRFGDAQRPVCSDPTILSNTDIAALKAMLVDLVNLPDQKFNQWLGQTLSAPKKELPPVDVPLSKVQAHSYFQLKSSAIICITETPDQTLSIDGEAIPTVFPLAEWQQALLAGKEIEIDDTILNKQNHKDWLAQLTALGLLFSTEDALEDVEAEFLDSD